MIELLPMLDVIIVIQNLNKTKEKGMTHSMAHEGEEASGQDWTFFILNINLIHSGLRY